MREETIEIYKFEELTEEAKEVARKWYKKAMDTDFHFEAECITEIFQDELYKLNYPIGNVKWSLSYRQGDGVAFYGRIDSTMLEKIIERHKEEFSKEEYNLYRKIIENDFTLYTDISRNSAGHYYSHYNTMSVETNGDDIGSMMEEIFDLDFSENTGLFLEKEEEIENLIEHIDRLILGEVQDISRKLESEGYSQIEYYYSNEAVDDNIINNDYEFTKDGKRW